MIKYLAGAAFLIAGLSAAAAETHSGDVRANRSTILNRHVYYNAQLCSSGPIAQVKLKKEPKHGTVKIVRSVWTPKKGKCKGKKFKGVDVIYTPKRGYRGPDEFSTKYSMPRYTNRSTLNYLHDTYKVKVK
ncbi:hypothetical protein PsW64_01122 [Pseudovibrio sp. W64]|uniref:hypothetical protein n=1 Tax=unclassified Pseudovibrio TaxID=2627060 RepID=UPI0007AE736F|nr:MULTISPECIES: hypothetical protein [unclassified Pseudovibrio]KZK75992.1 hypothetical protein PsAD13_05430 [Pseudovibrio sp. Ad13]KZK87825.1 hypothetical protein PsW64_01122 [Pseudovibrio sp. W64]